METITQREMITQRELRNDNAKVIDQVTQGHQFVVTRRGTPVAVVSPYDAEDIDRLIIRKGTGQMVFPKGIHYDQRSEDILKELRADS